MENSKKPILLTTINGIRKRINSSPADDVLIQAMAERDELKSQLAGETGVDPDRPLLVFAWPPDQIAAHIGQNAPFADFTEMTRFFADALVDVSGAFSIVIRPHPRLDSAKLGVLPRSLVVSRWDTAKLIAICDLYVATGSATTRWAIAAGKPVLEYDVFWYHLEDYKGLAGTVVLDEPDQFLKALRRAADDPAWLGELAEAQAKIASDWDRLDGRSGERIKALAWRLASQAAQ